jgi:zinc protease
LWYDDTAVFFGSTATQAASADETVELIHKDVRKLAEDGPTADELAAAKAYLNSSFVLNLDTSAKVASLLVQLQLDHLGVDYINTRKQKIAAVTLDDAKRVAKRLFGGGMLVTVVGRPAALASASDGRGTAVARVPPLLPAAMGGGDLH